MQNQLLWVGVMVFLALFGAILFVLVARPQPRAAVESADGHAGDRLSVLRARGVATRRLLWALA